MSFRSALKKVLLGNVHIQSRLEYKSAWLRGYMALICISVAIAYTVIDKINGVRTNFPFYWIVVLMGGLVIWLNRTRRYQLSSVIFLVTINFIIFLFASSDPYRTGIYIFFIASSLSAFALFGYRQIKLAVFFSCVSLLLFILSYGFEWRLLPVMDYSEKYITINFITNFIVALITSMLIVYFLINTNFRSEAALTRTTDELQKSRERNQMVLDAVDAGTYEFEPSTQAILVSDNWKKLLGYRADELEQIQLETYFENLHPADKATVEQNIARHLRDRKPYVTELRLRTKQGEYKWFLDCGSTRFDEKGAPTLTAGCIIDINERKKAEEKILHQNEQLEKANGELDRFVYSVSHDLRAPLSSILGLTNLYNLSSEGKERESIISLIKERALTLDSFISEILDYSRNARTELNTVPTNLNSLVHDILKGLTYVPGFERVRIDTDIPEALELRTDRARLKMVLNNLISNAIKYSDKQRESFVVIQATVNGSECDLSVRDNGIGIKPEHHARIFDMFYQAHDKAHGSGLGLYIVKETLQRLKGRITFQSEYGKGSTFTIHVPLKLEA